MADIYVRYTYDPTGKNPDNYVQGELHSLTPVAGFPYKIITTNNGGFFAKGFRVYDANYDRLFEGTDYILTYRYAHTSQMLGLEVVNDIVFLDKTRVGNVFISYQVVGGDVAFSLTGIKDYVDWYKTQPAGYVPVMFDYNGNEPTWLPGELDKERWNLDTYQPWNNEIYQIARASQGGRGIREDGFRSDVQDEYNKFLDKFNGRLAQHIADFNNPHVDTKGDVGLDLVENYRLATTTESRAGVSNVLYQTPALSWETVDALALVPLNNHIANRNNPHKTTAAKLDSPSKLTVDSTVNGKYTTTETVANASNLLNGAELVPYSTFYNRVRNNIPAGNFVSGGSNGYLNPYRLGNGYATADTVLQSGSVAQWTPFTALIQEFQPKVSAGCMVMNFAQGTSPQNAFAQAVATPWAGQASIGSIICWKMYDTFVWGAGNGTYVNAGWITYVAYKSASGWLLV